MRSRRTWLGRASTWLGATLFGAGCNQASRNGPSTPGAARFLALGDSYTIGESVAESERWPVQLAEALRKQGREVAPPTIIARTGWTTPELQAAVNKAAPQGPYQMVTLLIGVNDQFRGGKADDYRAPFRALLQHAITLAGGNAGHVVVLSIPDWGVTPFAPAAEAANISAMIDRFNAVNREEALAAKARYVDITPISREAKTNETLLARDQLHPSGLMYRRWVETTLPVAAEVVRRSNSVGKP